MKSVTEKRTKYSPSIPSRHVADLWAILQASAEKVVDGYVFVHETCLQMSTKQPKAQATKSVQEQNPHATLIASEHCYCSSSTSQVFSNRKTRLPQWLRSHEQTPLLPTSLVQKAPFNYSSVVLNDGLLLVELCDVIREGDGVCVLRYWKFMLLYWRHTGHTKYCLDAFRLLASVIATATPQIAHEIVWCRFVNSCGGAGKNIPVHLFMEHLNQTLKDYLLGFGANISETTIVQTTKSLHSL